MLLRPADHLAQRLLGGRQVALGRAHGGRDPQIFGRSHGIREAASDLRHLRQVAARQLELTAQRADLRPAPQGERPERLVPSRLRFPDSAVGCGERAVRHPLQAVGDRQVVVALGHALSAARPLEGRDGDLPGPDGLRIPPAQVADDAQIVRAAACHGEVPVPAGAHQRLREGVRRLVDPAADERGRAPRIERAALDRVIALPARMIQRQIEPPLSLLVTPQPRLGGPVQQREARRILDLAGPAPTEVLDDLGMLSSRGELLGGIDHERRRVHRVSPSSTSKPRIRRSDTGGPQRIPGWCCSSTPA